MATSSLGGRPRQVLSLCCLLAALLGLQSFLGVGEGANVLVQSTHLAAGKGAVQRLEAAELVRRELLTSLALSASHLFAKYLWVLEAAKGRSALSRSQRGSACPSWGPASLPLP